MNNRPKLLTLLFLSHSLLTSAQCILGTCTIGYGEKKFDAIKIYKGEFNASLFHGFGEVFIGDRLIYSGNWKDGKEDGFGIAYWNAGEPKYHGEYLNGKRHGFGTSYSIVGNVEFAGKFIDDVPQKIASSLPPAIQADKFLLEAKKFIDEKNYLRAVTSLNQILALDVQPPTEFYYHHGKACCLGKSYEIAIASLTKYLMEAGNSGEFYSSALSYLSEAEDLSRVSKFAEERDIIKNCSKCGGTGHYSCHNCKGKGRYSCKSCGFCHVCNGHGGYCLYNEYPCSNWMTCRNCLGDGNTCKLGHDGRNFQAEVTCSLCDGSSKIKCSH